MWILSDYGGVICHHQRPEDISAMARTADMEDELFVEAYWRYRAQYDRGDLDVNAYWTQVLGHQPSTEHEKTLDELDLKSWSRKNEACLRKYHQLVDSFDFGLLSNAPASLARRVERFDWMPPMEHMFFSCDLRITKPAPEIYREVLRRLGCTAENVIFVDDRLENTEAAAGVGMKIILFRDARDLDGLQA